MVTTRELLATQAPKDIPDWFKPKVDPEPKQRHDIARFYRLRKENSWLAEYALVAQSTAEIYGRELYDYITPPKEHADLVLDWADDVKRIKEWNDTYHKERLLQWPFAYADMVIERAGTTCSKDS